MDIAMRPRFWQGKSTIYSSLFASPQRRGLQQQGIHGNEWQERRMTADEKSGEKPLRLSAGEPWHVRALGRRPLREKRKGATEFLGGPFLVSRS